jgi:hypothetical protein
LRIFVDECDRLLTILVELKRRSTHDSLISYADRVLEASSCTWAKPEAQVVQDKLLSQRELDVLKNLASGLTYEEIGRHYSEPEYGPISCQEHLREITGEQTGGSRRAGPRDETDLM